MDTMNVTSTPKYNGTGLKGLSQNPHEIVALLLSSIAIVMNIFTLLSLSQLRKRLTAHYRLIISLAIADILVGSSILLFIIHKAANRSYVSGLGPPMERLKSRCSFIIIKSLNTTGLNICLLSLVGMGVDHFVAINDPMHYSKVMSVSRINILLTALWAVAIIGGFADFWTGFTYETPFINRNYNFCELVWESPYQDEYSLLCIAVVSFVVMSVLYTSIYRLVSSHRIPGVQPQDARRNRRALFTTVLILGTFILCWLPLCFFQIALMVKVKTNPTSIRTLRNILYQVDKYLYDLLLLNSIFDPIIYTVRMSDIQLGYRRLFRLCLRHVASEADILRARQSVSRTRSVKNHGGTVISNNKHFPNSSNCTRSSDSEDKQFQEPLTGRKCDKFIELTNCVKQKKLVEELEDNTSFTKADTYPNNEDSIEETEQFLSEALTGK